MLHLGYACLISGFCWAILGYVSAMLAFVGHELGPYWLYFWAHWAMLDILSRVGTILGSDWAILGYFGVCVGLCLGTWTFHCRWIFVHASHLQKNTVKTRESNDFLGCVAWWSLLLFCFFLLGYAAHRLCLPDLGLILGHSRLCQCHIDLMLGHFGLFCGLSWPLLGLLLWPYWHYLGPHWALERMQIKSKFRQR